MSHPLHPFHTGRDECDAVVASRTISRDKFCNVCHKVIKHKPAFRCLPCDFALCSGCSKGSVHPAHVGHALYFIATRSQSPWKCGGCNKTSQQIGDSGHYFCDECDFNLCKSCFQPVKLPLHPHWLTRTDVRYTYHQSNGDWRCDCCGGNNGAENFFPRHCSSCQFDVCDSCCKGWITPLHDHPLYKADSTLVYQQYCGGWRCDNCSARFRPDVDKNPYHCPECCYDLCKRCIGSSGSTVVRTTTIPGSSNSASTVLERRSNQRIITRTAAGNPVTTPVDDVEEEAATVPRQTSDLCVVCLSNAKDATIIHGGTGHVCCCFGCAQELKRRNAACPICRAPIELIIKQYTS